MSIIHGNTVGTTHPRANLIQGDATKPDYVHGKEEFLAPVEAKFEKAYADLAAKSHGNHVPTTQTADNATFLRNDNTWQKVTPANIGAAASSHGNHVPTTQTASNKVFLRNDNTWATVTPANIGAAASSHGTHVSYGTSAKALGTSSAGSAATVSRSDHVHALPALTSCTGTLSVAKGGTGATTAANARKNLELGTDFKAYTLSATNNSGFAVIKAQWSSWSVGAFIVSATIATTNGNPTAKRTWVGLKYDNNNGAVLEVEHTFEGFSRYVLKSGTWTEQVYRKDH